MGMFVVKKITDGFHMALALLKAACGGINMEGDFQDALQEAFNDMPDAFIMNRPA